MRFKDFLLELMPGREPAFIKSVILTANELQVVQSTIAERGNGKVVIVSSVETLDTYDIYGPRYQLQQVIDGCGLSQVSSSKIMFEI